MRRLLRWAFNFAVVASALLFAAECVLWVRSYRRTEASPFNVSLRGSFWRIESGRGRFTLSNGPQRDLESRLHDEAIRRESDELTRVVNEVGERLRAANDRFARAGRRDERARGEYVETARRLVAADAEQQRRYFNAERAPRFRTPPERHSVPDGPVAGLLAVLPAAWLLSLVSRRWRERSRMRRGRCPACGYDLRATPEEGGALLGRCPECGAVGTVPSGKDAG